MKVLEKYQHEFVDSGSIRGLASDGESKIIMRFDNGLYPVIIHKHNVMEDGVIEISDNINDKLNYLHVFDSSDLKWLGLAENLNSYCDYLRKKVDELNHDIVEVRNVNKVLTDENDRLSNRVKELVIQNQKKTDEKDEKVEETKSDDATTKSMVEHITLSKENEDLKYRIENLQKTSITYREDLMKQQEENTKLKEENEKLLEKLKDFETYKLIAETSEEKKKERQSRIKLLKELMNLLLDED
jgi:regulator of replication initiation timing